MRIVGVDAGRFKVKVWYSNSHFDFYSNLGEYREFEFQDERGKDDIIGEYRGRKFTGGTLARRESEFGDSLMVESKLHEDTVILILIALHNLRLHPAAYEHLRVYKFHTQKSFNELINFLIKEALETERIKQKVLDMYLPSVSQYMIRDWRDNI